MRIRPFIFERRKEWPLDRWRKMQDDEFVIQKYVASNRSVKQNLCTMTLNSCTEQTPEQER